MKANKLKIAALALLLVSAILAPVSVSAQEESTDLTEEVVLCDTAIRINEKLSTYQSLKDTHIEAYGDISGHFQNIVLRLDEGGFDTGLLEELQPGIERRVNDFSVKADLLITELTEASTLACEEDSTAFDLALEEARTALAETYNASLEVQQYLVGVVIPAVRTVVTDATSDITQ